MLEDVVQLKRDVLHLQLAGLDFREIEDIVDDVQQRIGGQLDLRDIVLLAVIQGRAQTQFGHTDDRVHRRANFMRHIGQEGALRLAGLQGFATRIFEFVDQGAHARDVAGNAQHAELFAILAAHRSFNRFQQSAMSIAVKGHPFFAHQGRWAGASGQIIATKGFGDVMREKVMIGFAQNFRRRRPQQTFKGRIAGQKYALLVFHPHQIGDGAEYGLQQRALVLGTFKLLGDGLREL